MSKTRSIIYSLLAIALAIPGLASAQTVTDSATLTLEVNSRCTITADNHDIGLVTGWSWSDNVGNIRVICNEGQVYTLGISSGLSGDETERFLYLNGDPGSEFTIPYTLSHNQTTTNWGDANPADRVSAQASGTWDTHHFRLSVGANGFRYAPGNYSDNLTATVYY
ncbi:MAG: spore coat protein U domain-containing protein [Lysobacteraceae bacterium]